MVRHSRELKPRMQVKVDGSQFCTIEAKGWEATLETIKAELSHWNRIQVFEQETDIYGLPAYAYDYMSASYKPVFKRSPIHTERR